MPPHLEGIIFSKKHILPHAEDNTFSRKCPLPHAEGITFSPKWPLPHAEGITFTEKWPLLHAEGNTYKPEWLILFLLKALIILVFWPFLGRGGAVLKPNSSGTIIQYFINQPGCIPNGTTPGTKI